MKRALVAAVDTDLSVARQCALLGLARSRWCYTPAGESAENLELMRQLDEQYTRTPFYGIRRMTAWQRQQGYPVNHKRVGRLLRPMGLEAVYPKPRLSAPGEAARRHPYLLRGVTVARADRAWSTDITCVRLQHDFVYLVAILDRYSRYVLAWELSNTLDTGFCLAALETTLAQGQPAIFNTDQGGSSPVLPIPTGWKRRGSRSVGTGAGGRWTTSSSSGCGARSSGRWSHHK